MENFCRVKPNRKKSKGIAANIEGSGKVRPNLFSISELSGTLIPSSPTLRLRKKTLTDIKSERELFLHWGGVKGLTVAGKVSYDSKMIKSPFNLSILSLFKLQVANQQKKYTYSLTNNIMPLSSRKAIK